MFKELKMRILTQKMYFQTFIVISLSLLLCVNCQNGESGLGLSSLDLTEIESIHYDVNIGGIPILEQTLASEEKFGIPMTNKFGQKYFCTLPKATLNDDDEDEEVIDENGQKSTAKKVVNVPAEIPELLAPMAKEPCLFKTKDWWTYEICYHKVAKQYHVEDGRPSGAIMILGYYDHDLEWPVAKGSEEKEDPLQTLRHHKQFYTNGSKCDLTGDMRKTEVRYECDPLAVVDFISSVDEPQSCEYVMVVRTSKICSIPQLKPPPTKKPKPIDCSPILNEQEYQKYEHYLIAKQKYEEKKAKEQKIFQRDHMLKLLDGEDLTGIDIDTDEGLAIVESRVGERMAEKLVSELGLMFDPSKKGSRRKTFGSLEDLFKTDPKENPIEEFKAPNGQMQSRLKKNENPNWDTLSKSKQNAEAKTKKTKGVKVGDEKKSDKKIDKKNVDKKSSVNLDPRSDLSDEDEMLDVLLDTFRRMSGDENQELKLLKEELKAIRETVSDSIEDILEETENEMNMKLDGLDRHHAIDQLSQTLNELMNKLDETEADIARMNSKIEKVQEVIDGVEDDGVFHHKHEKKVLEKPVKKKDFLFDNEEDEDDLDNDEDSEDAKKDKKKVNVKVTNFSHAKISGLPESSPSEERVIKHLESAIKEKLEHSGLDTGGRQIEVKLITATSYPGGGDTGDLLDNQLDGDVQGDEARQIQHMIYNLMIGDHVGYQDIDTQRKSERNYKFSFDESELILNDADEENVKSESEGQSEKEENQKLNEEEEDVMK